MGNSPQLFAALLVWIIRKRRVWISPTSYCASHKVALNNIISSLNVQAEVYGESAVERVRSLGVQAFEVGKTLVCQLPLILSIVFSCR